MYSVTLGPGSLTQDTRMSDVASHNPDGVPGTFSLAACHILISNLKRKLTVILSVNSGDLPQQRDIPSVLYYR